MNTKDYFISLIRLSVYQQTDQQEIISNLSNAIEQYLRQLTFNYTFSRGGLATGKLIFTNYTFPTVNSFDEWTIALPNSLSGISLILNPPYTLVPPILTNLSQFNILRNNETNFEDALNNIWGSVYDNINSYFYSLTNLTGSNGSFSGIFTLTTIT